MEYRRSITAGHSPFTRYMAKAAWHQTGRHHHTRSRPISPYKVKDIVCPSTQNSEKVRMWFWCNFNHFRIFLCPSSEHGIREGCEEQAYPFLSFPLIHKLTSPDPPVFGTLGHHQQPDIPDINRLLSSKSRSTGSDTYSPQNVQRNPYNIQALRPHRRFRTRTMHRYERGHRKPLHHSLQEEKDG